MEYARAHVVVSGRVQGVYYRASTRDEAAYLKLTGWVRNLPDGRVEAIFEGPKEKIGEILQWCAEGPPGAEVSDVDARWEIYKGEFKVFEIRA